MNDEKNDENYSRNADQTRYIFLIGIIAVIALVGLFALETFSIIKYTMSTKASNGYVPHYLHP